MSCQGTYVYTDLATSAFFFLTSFTHYENRYSVWPKRCKADSKVRSDALIAVTLRCTQATIRRMDHVQHLSVVSPRVLRKSIPSIRYDKRSPVSLPQCAGRVARSLPRLPCMQMSKMVTAISRWLAEACRFNTTISSPVNMYMRNSSVAFLLFLPCLINLTYLRFLFRPVHLYTY